MSLVCCVSFMNISHFYVHHSPKVDNPDFHTGKIDFFFFLNHVLEFLSGPLAPSGGQQFESHSYTMIENMMLFLD